MKRRIFNTIIIATICCTFTSCKNLTTDLRKEIEFSNKVTVDTNDDFQTSETTTLPVSIQTETIITTIEAKEEKPEYIYVTTNDNLNFRRQDNTDSDIICVIPSGTKVKLLDFNSNSNFYICEFEGVTGYLFKEYVNVTEEKIVAKKDTSIQVLEEVHSISKNDIIEIYKVDGSYLTEDFEKINSIILEDFTSYSKYLESILDSCNTEILTSFSTAFTKGNNRAYNIALAASEIDSIVIAKGENFNWHEIVGNTGEKEGYMLAGVYYDGKSDEGYGGGVCQVSTTLYNCVLNMNMEVIERHKHSLPVSYVDYYSGKDAAVGDIGAQNLIFKNNTDSDIVIKAYVTDDSTNSSLEIITVEFYKIII